MVSTKENEICIQVIQEAIKGDSVALALAGIASHYLFGITYDELILRIDNVNSNEKELIEKSREADRNNVQAIFESVFGPEWDVAVYRVMDDGFMPVTITAFTDKGDVMIGPIGVDERLSNLDVKVLAEEAFNKSGYT